MNGVIMRDNSDQFEPIIPNFAKTFYKDQITEQHSESTQKELEQQLAGVPINTKTSKYLGLTFRDYLEQNAETSHEMRKLVEQFLVDKSTRHYNTHLTLRKLQVRHPIFRLINLQAFKWLTDRAAIMKLKRG